MRLWETPVPIPNTTVKTQTADDTSLEERPGKVSGCRDYGLIAQPVRARA